MAKETRKPGENKMGTMPENRLLLSMSLPMMISMLVQALYNIVDSMFVSMINEDALTAVSLAFPIQSLLISFGVGTGVGINALLSRSLGEKDQKMADKTAANGIFLGMMTYLVFLIIGFVFTKPFYLSQTNDAAIVKYGVQYLEIVCVCSIGMLMQMVLEKLLQSTGRTMFTMITQATGAVINIVMDPILIFGLFGMPEMGVAGAAAATIFGQCAAGLMALFFNLKYNHDIHLTFRGFRPDMDVIKRIYAVGLPSIIMQSIGSIMTYGMNRILIQFTSTATAVFGVYFKVQSFVFMPVFGLNNGMVPIIAYNYGAGKRERVVRTMKLSVIYAVLIMTAGTALFQICPGWMLGLFQASDLMLEIGIPALRILSLIFIMAAFNIAASSWFQALGNGVYSLIVSCVRQLVVLLPAAYVLSMFGKLELVWWAFPISEVCAFTLSALYLAKINKDIIRKIGQE